MITACRLLNKSPIAPHLTFDAITAVRTRCTAGTAAARLCGVDALLDDPRSRRSATWAYRAVAPSQRGYSPVRGPIRANSRIT
jgi:hypothetical protein